ncbi:MAG: FecR family protein [Gammaproteobacteria bacterium]|nr:FecR family protein [Gammaproteobacteria bacterium]
MNKNTNYFNGLAGIPVIFLFFMLFSFAVAAAEPIARVIVSSGHFTAVQPDGKERVLKRRSAIFEGDTLITAEDARAQIRFKDGALIDIQAATQLRLDEYNYQGQVDGTEKNTMSLIKGGFRTITGVVGKKNKKNYKVNTPVATIGIRGTHYGLHYCGSDCGVDTGNGQQNKKGLFGGVVDGAVVANNDSGEIRLGNDEYFHVASKSAEPKVLLVPPAIIFKGSELQVTESMTKETGDSGATTTETVFTEEVAVSENYEVAYSDPDTGPVSDPVPTPASNPVPVPDTPPDPLPQKILTGAPGTFGIGSQVSGGGGTHSITGIMGPEEVSVVVNANNQPLSFYVVDPAGSTDPNPCSPCTLDATSATLVQAGGDALGVNWGRWQKDTYVITKNGQTETMATDFNFIYSDKITPASTYQAMNGDVDIPYTLVAARASNQANVQMVESGAVTSAVKVNFFSQSFTQFNMNFNVSGEIWTTGIDGGSVLFSQAFSQEGISMTGTCSGGACSSVPAVSGNVSPVFVGTNAEGIISSYGFKTETGDLSITGVAFHKQ